MARCDTYAPGQCTAGACEAAGWVPDGLGNGGQWAANAPSHGLQVTMVPTVGAVVSYCPGDGYSEFGHCGVVTAVYADGSFEIHEMNFVAAFVYDDRHSSSYDVCGFILPPGVQPGQGGAGPGGQGAGTDASGLPNDFAGVWAEASWWMNTGVPIMIGQHDQAGRAALQAVGA